MKAYLSRYWSPLLPRVCLTLLMSAIVGEAGRGAVDGIGWGRRRKEGGGGKSGI